MATNTNNGKTELTDADALLFVLGAGKISPTLDYVGSFDTEYEEENVLAYNDWQTVSSPSPQAQELMDLFRNYTYTGTIEY